MAILSLVGLLVLAAMVGLSVGYALWGRRARAATHLAEVLRSISRSIKGEPHGSESA